MAEPSRLSPDSALESAPKVSFLQSALGLLRGTRPRDAGPTIRGMFAVGTVGGSRDDANEADEIDAPAMRAALKHELSRVNGSRYVLRHLAMIEHELKAQGLAVFDKLPVRVLEKAAVQLESLVQSPVSPGVAALRSRLRVAVMAREKVERPIYRTGSPATSPVAAKAASTSPPSTGGHGAARGQPFDPATLAAAPVSASTFAALTAWSGEGKLEVSEASVDDFEKATTEWTLLDEPRPQ